MRDNLLHQYPSILDPIAEPKTIKYKAVDRTGEAILDQMF